MPERGDDALIERVAAELRTPLVDDAAADARIMAAIRAQPHPWPSGLGGVWSWLREPRPLRLSPLAGLAAAAGVVALTAIAFRAGTSGTAVSRHADPPPSAPVEFVLVAPAAHTVSLVGDFNDWDPAVTPLVSSGGVWSTSVPLPAGRHRYAFLVDGTRWVADPAAPRAADDAFGTPNSVVTVGT